jgi:hypothetical protein
MEADNFYMTLPSNASMDLYPGNVLSEYKVQLPRTLHLNHEYETALVEMTYPVTYDILPNTNYDIAMLTVEPGGTFTAKVEGISFSSVRKLIAKVNTTLTHMSKTLKVNDGERVMLSHVSDQEKLKLHVPPNTGVFFEKGIAAILGFKAEEWILKSTKAENHYDLQGGFHSLYVYCSAVEPQIVGDIYAPLLRTVGLTGLKGETIVRNFIDPHYIKVNVDELRSLEINVKDDTGQNVLFRSGKVICKLHFRRR